MHRFSSQEFSSLALSNASYLLLFILGRLVLPEGPGQVPDSPVGTQPGLHSAPHCTGYLGTLAKSVKSLALQFGKAVLLD